MGGEEAGETKRESRLGFPEQGGRNVGAPRGWEPGQVAPSSAAASPGAGRWQSPSSNGIPGAGKEPDGAVTPPSSQLGPAQGDPAPALPKERDLFPCSDQYRLFTLHCFILLRLPRETGENRSVPIIRLPSVPGLEAPRTKLWIDKVLLVPVTAGWQRLS